MSIHTMSWKLESDINSQATLFADQTLPYIVDSYICHCGNIYTDIRNKNNKSINVECNICGNNSFLNANKYISNKTWYEPIKELFSKQQLMELNPRAITDDSNNLLSMQIVIKHPHKTNLLSNKLFYKEKVIFEVLFTHKQIEQKLKADFSLETLYQRDKYNCFFRPPPEDVLIDRHSLLHSYKEKMLAYIKDNAFLDMPAKELEKFTSLEQVNFFINNPHLKEFNFIYWNDVALLPKHEDLTILGALKYIADNRKEKSLRKEIYLHYQKNILKDAKYSFRYMLAVSKNIKDVNIAVKMINIDIEKHIAYDRCHETLEYMNAYQYIDLMESSTLLLKFIKFLATRYSDKQILALFKQYDSMEKSWFLDTLNLFNEVSDKLDDFISPKCNNILFHNAIAKYHRVVVDEENFKLVFTYTKEELDKCTNIGPYKVILPKSGKELHNWSIALNNCLTSYIKQVAKKQCIIYAFSKYEKPVFAVSIRDEKIVEAKANYNSDLFLEDAKLLNKWFRLVYQNRLKC